MPRQYDQDHFVIKNTDKYIGDPAKCRYLSSYERVFMEWADRSSAVVRWGSEIVVVKYVHPYKLKQDNKTPYVSRYIVDIYIEYKDKNGELHKELIEIKPENQCTAPKKGNKKESTFLQEHMTWSVNQAKWQAAEKFAKERGWKFKILTERAIFK